MPLPPPIPPTLRLTFRLFWCYQCRRPVSILPSLFATSDFFCPRCFGPFVHDLDTPSPPLLLPPPANFHFEFPSPHPNFHLHHLFPPWTPFHLQHIHGHHALPPPPLPASTLPQRSYSIPPTLDPGEYFTGPNFSELVQELTENDHTGPPPASNSSIDALPTVVITVAHLRGGSECPVCKEEFFVGEEAREMPCRHVYHSDCIVPWLRIHNSCPVCRLQLAVEEPAAGEQSRERSGGGGGGNRTHRRQRRRQVQERWNPFTMLSAFRGGSSPPGWDRRHSVDRREQEVGDPLDSPAEQIPPMHYESLAALKTEMVALHCSNKLKWRFAASECSQISAKKIQFIICNEKRINIVNC